MPFGLSLSGHGGTGAQLVGGRQPKIASRLQAASSVQELRSSGGSSSSQRQADQQPEQQQQQPATDMAASKQFRLVLLGRQALSRPNGTGFGSVQKPLKEIYLSHLTATAGSEDSRDQRLTERIASFDGQNLQLRCGDPQQQQPETYPLDCLAYIDLVLFHTVKGRKRHFGYFRRHSDSTEVVPDSVLIPLHKKDHRLVTKAQHKPMLCLIVRRPHGIIQFLECHVYQLEAEQAGLDFIREIDLRSEARQAAETRSQFACHRQQQQQQEQQEQPTQQEVEKAVINKWASQPLLLKTSAAQQQATSATATDHQAEQQRPIPQPRRTVNAPQVSSNEEQAEENGEGAGQIRRTASGTIFDKYKELRVFNIPEYEYMGFQELQEVRRSVEERRQQRQQQQQPQRQTSTDNGSEAEAAAVRQSGSRIPVPTQSQRPPRPPTSGGLQKSASTDTETPTQQPQPPPPPRLPPRSVRDVSGGGFNVGAKFPSDGNIKARQLQPPTRCPTSAADLEAPQQRGPLSTSAAGGQQRTAGYSSFAPTVQQQPPAPSIRAERRRLELPPTPTDGATASADAAKPVARVVPTARPLPGMTWQHQQQQLQKSASGWQQHRVHHRSGSGSSRQQAQQQQQQQQASRLRPAGGSARVHSGSSSSGIGSTPDFAAALGYLP